MSNAEQSPATFEVDGKTLRFDRVPAVEGSDGVNISSLLKETGLVTLDPGFVNTASTTSSITYIDGEAGILRYRGYPIDQLAKGSNFLETAYLLIYGELPDADTLEAVARRIKRHMILHEDFKAFFTAFPANGHPMSILQAGIAALGTYYQHTLDPHDEYQRELSTVLLMAKVPTMIAAIAKRANGLPLLYPDASKPYVEDFIRMTFGLPYQRHDVDPAIVKALDMLLILHADHEQNCSTSTVRMVGSAHANVYSSIAAGVGALSGPLHGGANEAVLEMLGKIQNADYSVEKFMEKVKNKEDGVRLMGFGHRVYKNYDPRAAIVKEAAHDVLARLGKNDELLDIAMGLEEIALNDEYFIQRKLYPNVDFYTGLIYKAMGFPTQMFTPLFALGRLPGWIAQYREMIADPSTKIGRPRQVYTGAPERDFVPVEKR
ncbi:citrate synthase [Georgenia subflava]|uniref:Citrate synthase n=1 Tax=Georgenia subflava TaxID=1622177 RepID=A0A6N7ENW7_9MICO|nr:citrate synthase [Georgenia subflava]MPV36924.1 citrate synthase [Georgenia subflava]